MKTWDVIVVGGGIAGLSTAALLSKRGQSCLVLEKLTIPGGRSRVVEHGGFVIDYGIHAHRFAGEGKAAAVLRKCGVRPRFLPVGKPLVYFGGKFVPFPKSPADIFTSPLMGFTSKLKMLKIFIDVLTKKKTAELYRKSVLEWLEESGIKEADLHDMTRLICTAGLVCSDIERASAGELFDFLNTAIRAKEATGYLLGGWDMLIEKLVQVIEQNGEVRLGAKVEKIIVEQSAAIGVLTSEGEIRARAVIAAIPIQEAGSVLSSDHFSPEMWNKIRALEPTAGLSLDFCLSKRISDIDGIVFTTEPYTMGMFTSNVEPAMAPRGKQLGTWYYPLPPSKMDDKELIKTERIRLKSILDSMFPGIWDNLEYERFIAMDMVDGAVPIVGQSSRERPSVSCSNVHGLFFAGDSLGVPGQGGDVAFNSALHCAEKVAAFLK